MQIRKYFKGKFKIYIGLGVLLTSLSLDYLEVEEFQKKFGCTTEEETAKFILNPENSYIIGKWSNEQRNPICARRGRYSSKGKVKGDDGGRF